MINAFKAKKYGAILLTGFLSCITFVVGSIYYKFIGGLVFFFIGLIVSVIIGIVLLKNPFTEMLEGAGLLLLNIDSTGVIRPTVVKVKSPYIKGKIENEEIEDVFNRDTILQLAQPESRDVPILKTKDGSVFICLQEEDYNKGRFALFHYPVIIWNNQIKSILTKDFLADQEKDIFAEHGILYLNRKMHELTSVVRDFGRYVVELTKPQSSFFQSKLFLIILIVGLVVLGLIFAPKIIEIIQGAGGSMMGAVKTAAPPISPLT